MNKRGQLYLLAVILMCLAIYGIVKVHNKIEAPEDTEFGFFIDNFKGERTQVVNLGYINPGEKHLDDMATLFAEFGWNTGIILIEPTGGGYNIYNFMDDSISICKEGGCEIETGSFESIGKLDFNFGTGKSVRITDSNKVDLDISGGYPIAQSSFDIGVEGNLFHFDNPGYKTIIFKDIDENFKMVEVI